MGIGVKVSLGHGCSIVAACLILTAAAAAQDEARFLRARRDMVEHQLAARDIRDPRVLAAMGRVPRHLFVPSGYLHAAYGDHPLPIEEGQTISQPYVVALMSQLLELTGAERVLEVGTGSGYQAAVLAELAKEIYTIEILPRLAETARARLKRLGYASVIVRAGDGYQGWPEAAPFDAVIVTAAASDIPAPLIAQLKEGGRLVIPVGPSPVAQELLQCRKSQGQLLKQVIAPVRFVPLVEPRR